MAERSTGAAFACGALLWLACQLSATAGDWAAWLDPQGRGDGNAVSAEPLPADLVIDFDNAAWRTNVGIGFSAVAVSGGRVFATGHNGEKGPRGNGGQESVWCFDASNGELIWKDEYDAPLLPNLHDGGPGASPVVADGVLYTVSKDGRMHSYEASSGKLNWSRELMSETGMRRPPEWGYAGSPVILGDWVLVESGSTMALDRKTGEVAWRSKNFTPAYGSATVFEQGGQSWVAVLKTEGLVILDPKRKGGSVAFHPWETSFQTNANTPMAIGNQLFVSTGYDRGCTLLGFDGTNLSVIYENQTMCNHMGNAVLINGHLYGFDGTAHRGREVELVCMELASGEEKWRHKGLRYGTLIGAGDQLVVLSERGELLIGKASPQGWDPVHEEQILGGRCWTMPIWSNGLLYLRNSRGDLLALKLAK
jgi:outer membrane protein assembly factor BamB